MGKNGKKVKSERINAIRKQYDAFLEEDRKRKDRNEYILERLDKMRSCNAVVPVRHTQTTKVFADLNIPTYEKTNHYTGRTFSHEQPRSTLNQVYNSNVITTTNEEDLIKELRKKYILIPKHQRALDFEYNHPTKTNVEDVNDWRSKYSILEELKKNEKEEENIFVQSKETHSNTIRFGDDNKVNINDKPDNPEFIIKVNDKFQTAANLQQPVLNIDTKNTENKQELSDSTNVSKYIPISEIRSEFNEYNSNIEGNHQPTDDLTEKEKLQAKYELECKPQSEENCVKEMQNNQYLNSENRWQEEHREEEFLSKSVINEQEKINELPIQNHINPEKDKIEDVSEIINQDDVYTPKIEQSQKSEVAFENKTIEPEMLNNPEDCQAQNNEDDVQAVTRDEVNEGTIAVENEEIQQEIIENVHQQVAPVQQYEENQTDTVYPTNSQQEYENTVDEQIQDFKADQNNMFYSEQTGDYTYGETGTADTTVEYANNEGYEHNENYAYYEETSHNQDYSTDYEATPQNQVYNNEINEHEESTEQYDLNYQNQYENYGQEEPPPETVQEYTAEEYDTQQNFDQTMYEESNYNAAEVVQQQIDHEEVYTKTLEEVKSDLEDIPSKEELPENPVVEQEVKVQV